MLLFVDKHEFQILKTFILRFHVNLELNKRLKLIFKFFFRRKDMNSFLIINVNLIMLFNCIYIFEMVSMLRERHHLVFLAVLQLELGVHFVGVM